MNQRLSQLLATVFFLLTAFSVCWADEKPVLRVYNWSEFIDIDESLDERLPLVERSPSLKAFVAEHDCKLEYYEYDDTTEMTKAVENIDGFYDVVIAAHGDVANLIQADKIAKLNKSLLPNMSYTDPEYSQFEWDKEGEFSAPYLVGTTGLLYRKDLVGYDVSSWKTLFYPDEQISGKVNILDDALLSFSIALQSIGLDPNTQDPAMIKKAGRLIYNLKKRGILKSCTADITEITTMILNGDIAITPMFSGNALIIIEKAPQGQIDYVIPNEGGEYYIDSFVVLKTSKQKELAHKFINFMLRPEIHAQNAIYLKFMCPNKEGRSVINQIAPGQLANPAIYPKKEILDKLKVYHNNNSEIHRLWDKIFWNRIF